MSTATHTNNGRAPVQTIEGVVAPARRLRSASALVEHFELPYVFADTVLRYLLRVLPCVTWELAHWRTRAADIPNPLLREHARASLEKRGNVEGAALFAMLAPAAQRRRTVRALVAYQTAYNYLDTLAEQPSGDPAANGRQLHQALLTALDPNASHPDYYAHNPDRGDGGYLAATLDACTDALVGLPSYPAVGGRALTAAGRIVDFQALNLSEPQGGHGALQAWAEQETPAGSGLAWWETAAAAGSSLAVHALIAAAANPTLDACDLAAIDRAYFPWPGALHSLLDSLIDRREDHHTASVACWTTTARPRGRRSVWAHSRHAPGAPWRVSRARMRTG